MGKVLGLPEVLETDDEDENHLGLARPKKVLWLVCNLIYHEMAILPQNDRYHFVVKRDYRQTTAAFKARPSLSGSHPHHLSPKPQVGPETSPFSRNRILLRYKVGYLFKVGALFDLCDATPPRPQALEA